MRPRRVTRRGVTVIELMIAVCVLTGAAFGAMAGARTGPVSGVLGLVLGAAVALGVSVAALILFAMVVMAVGWWQGWPEVDQAAEVPPPAEVADRTAWGAVRDHLVGMLGGLVAAVVLFVVPAAVGWLAQAATLRVLGWIWRRG